MAHMYVRLLAVISAQSMVAGTSFLLRRSMTASVSARTASSIRRPSAPLIELFTKGDWPQTVAATTVPAHHDAAAVRARTQTHALGGSAEDALFRNGVPGHAVRSPRSAGFNSDERHGLPPPSSSDRAVIPADELALPNVRRWMSRTISCNPLITIPM
jgi:hypothetical protein